MKLICGDGSEVRLPKRCLAKISLFKNQDTQKVHSYTLQCKARPHIVNVLLDLIEGESELTIAEDNFQELQNLCRELGYSGLDKELRNFETESRARNEVKLWERVMRHDKLLAELQRQFRELLSLKSKKESKKLSKIERSMSLQVQSLERKVEEISRVSEEQNAHISRKMKKRLKKFAKASDLDSLARDVAQLKEHETKVRTPPLKSPNVTTQPARKPTVPAQPVVKPVAAAQPVFKPVPAAQPVFKPVPAAQSIMFQNWSVPSNYCNDLARMMGQPALPPLNPVQPPSRIPGKRREFFYTESKPLEGVIAYLTHKCGGNVYDKGVVDVLASSVLPSKFDEEHPKWIVELGTDSCWGSWTEENTWICYDFKNRLIIPKSYSVRSCDEKVGGNHLKAWVIEVSNNGVHWTEIDRRENNSDLNAPHVTRNFKISPVPNECFRLFRLRQTAPNHHSPPSGYLMWFVRLTSMEVFGTLYED